MKLCRFLITATVLTLLLTSTVSAAEVKKHTVQKGETFYSISKKYNVTVQELLEMNNLTDSAVLKAGDTLIVEKPSSIKANTTSSVTQKTEKYLVAKGDTLYSIARNHETTVAELQKLNSLESGAVLKVGQSILVPASTTAGNDIKNNTSSETTVTVAKTTEDPRSYDSKKKGDVTLVWPVKAQEVTYVTGKISGVSITASSKNEKVTAIRGGTVMSCSTYRGFGQVVFVQASSGHIYVYSGMDTVLVSQGQTVKFGDSLGTCGTDALSGKNSISLMVYQNGKVLDPAKAPRG
ncbi:MAG: M23 family metallopeptidase [Treponemataceae bacterium]|nr:M23 family metallopeptidase [Treponemataceae bacterium]